MSKNWVFTRETNGDPRFTVCEPMTLVREYPAQWSRPEINLRELARLRKVQGWTHKQLGEHFGRSRSWITGALKQLGAKPSRIREHRT